MSDQDESLFAAMAVLHTHGSALCWEDLHDLCGAILAALSQGARPLWDAWPRAAMHLAHVTLAVHQARRVTSGLARPGIRA